MKGIIILPKYLKKLWTPKVSSTGFDFSNVLSPTAPFYYAIHEAFGFKIQYTDEVGVLSDTDIVFMFGVPYHNRPKLIPGLLDLNKNIKLVMYPGDLQCYDSELCLENKIKVFKRCDLIISGGHEYFVKMYPQFLSKYEFMPMFFSPHERYMQLSLNNDPKMRCLLSGALNPNVYPLRAFVNKKSRDVDHRPSKYRGDSYAKLLHSYFCCVTSSSIFNCAVTKYFEIPATGSLLLANETADLKKAGFVPHRHYIPVTKKDVLEKISHCLKNPAEYDHIRREGMEFVRKYHSVVNRIDRLGEIFDDLINERSK
jgi:hypothetical protein